MTGGRGANFTSLPSVEFFGPQDCTVAALPEPRSGHVTFVTPDKRVATCGGWTGETRELSSGCLVLNTTAGAGGEWQGGVMGDLVLDLFPTTCPTTDGGACVFPFIDSELNLKPNRIFLG